jgi:hypothetical protein
MEKMNWHIYLGEIPHCNRGSFWVSFESDPRLKKTRADIYGRCLPCIQNLYEQLRACPSEIDLGMAYHCWKITAVLEGIEQCLSLLSQFEARFPFGHVSGKFGSGRPDSETRVVVFHTDNEKEKDRIQKALRMCLKELNLKAGIQVSRACAILYEPILGDWKMWRPKTPIRFPERINEQLELVRGILFHSTM